jgi:hypothetical protein
VRRTNDQTVTEQLSDSVAESVRLHDLAARFAMLTRRLVAGARGNIRRDQRVDGVAQEARDSSRPIELVLENGFSITRPWETEGGPVPTGANCQFRVSDASGVERKVCVEISRSLIAETALHTGGRIQSLSSFWVCSAERHLANYVWEHDTIPEGDYLVVETLDPEEVMLATRWSLA